jgi:hypothetical protein
VAAGVSGTKQLSRKLRDIANAPTASVRKAARAAALQPINDQAALNLRANGSVITGKLLNGLRVVQTGRNETRFGQVGRHEPVAHLVEFGTAPHWQPRYRGGWMHPGARPYPFARPAFEQHKDLAVKIYVEHLWKEIQRQAR